MKSRKLKVASSLLFVAVAGGIASSFWIFKSDPEPSKLMSIAQTLVDTKEWSSINRNFHAPTAKRWINDEEVVFLEKQANGPYFLHKQKVLPIGRASEPSFRMQLCLAMPPSPTLPV